MQDAAVMRPGSMAAIIGQQEQITEEICRIVETLLHDESENPQLFSKMLEESFQDFISSQGMRAAKSSADEAPATVLKAMSRGA